VFKEIFADVYAPVAVSRVGYVGMRHIARPFQGGFVQGYTEPYVSGIAHPGSFFFRRGLQPVRFYPVLEVLLFFFREQFIDIYPVPPVADASVFRGLSGPVSVTHVFHHPGGESPVLILDFHYIVLTKYLFDHFIRILRLAPRYVPSRPLTLFILIGLTREDLMPEAEQSNAGYDDSGP